jgi:hypothetical protein
VIFIYEAFKELAQNFSNPAIAGLQATVSLIVALTTFFTANTLSKLRRTSFLPRKAREVVSDFAPTLGVLAGIKTAYMAINRYDLTMPMLAVPEVLATTSGRPWVVDLFSVSPTIRLMCLIPALMAFILLFMDQNITVRLVMAKVSDV